MKTLRAAFYMIFLAALAASAIGHAAELKVPGIFSSNMVLQREKPIKIWGWAPAGQTVSVAFGQETVAAEATGEKGVWEVVFPAREANSAPLKLVVTCGEASIEMVNIVVGDVWVMNGQSNMAFGLGKVQCSDMEAAMANLPLFL